MALRMLDLFAGLGGASAAMKDRGWEVITADNDPAFGCTFTADLSDWSYTGEPLDLIWASPPCQEFSRWSMPWTRQRNPPAPSMALVNAAIRIINECVPTWFVVENVRGALPFISLLLGQPRASYKAYFLWGRFPRFKRRIRKPKKESFSSTQVAKRSMIPYELSLGMALACESELPFPNEGSAPS